MRDLLMNEALRHQILDSGFASVFNGGTLNLRTGSKPAVTAAETGTLIAGITLPTPAFDTAASGIKLLDGTWQDAAADADGLIAWFRLKNSGDTMRLDGTCGLDTTVETSGTATAGAAKSLTNSGAAMTVNAHRGADVVITGGTGSGQRRMIEANSATELFIATPWATNPSTDSTYEVRTAYDLRLSVVNVLTGDAITITAFSFSMFRFGI